MSDGRKRARSDKGKQVVEETSFDSTIYASSAAEERSKGKMGRKTFVSERGLEVTNDTMLPHITARKWTTFVQQPEEGNASVVRQFYINWPDAKDGKVFVRGKYVKVGRTVFNQHYGLEDVDDSEFVQFMKAKDNALILRTIAANYDAWGNNPDLDIISLARGRLDRYSRAWHHFIAAKINPSAHLSTVGSDKGCINYAIQAGMAIDIGRVMELNMGLVATKDKYNLFYPSFITALCKAEGVPMEDDEETVPTLQVITQATVDGYEEDSSAPPVPPAPRAQPRGTPSIHARLDAVEERMDAMATSVGHIRDRLDSLVTSYESRDRRMESMYEMMTSMMRHLHVPTTEESEPHPPPSDEHHAH